MNQMMLLEAVLFIQESRDLFSLEKISYIYLTFFFLTIIYSSCKKEEYIPQSLSDGKYFPMKLGSWTIYEVDSVFYDDFYEPTKIDTIFYHIKEVVADTFRDLTGNLTYKIERFRRTDSSDNWVLYNVWTVNKFDRLIERTEQNLRYIKMVFPIDEFKTWKGNSYINATGTIDYMDGWDYIYSEIHKKDTINNLMFDSTVFIIQKDDVSLIRKDYFIEQYAKGVGLIFKESSHLSKQNINEDWQSGFYIKYQIMDYKN